MKTISRRYFVCGLPFLGVGLSTTVSAQNAPPPATLLRNVRIFDGTSDALSGRSDLLVRSNIIERIATAPMTAEPGIPVIDCGGRTWMTGLADMPSQAMFVRPIPGSVMSVQ